MHECQNVLKFEIFEIFSLNTKLTKFMFRLRLLSGIPVLLRSREFWLVSCDCPPIVINDFFCYSFFSNTTSSVTTFCSAFRHFSPCYGSSDDRKAKSQA